MGRAVAVDAQVVGPQGVDADDDDAQRIRLGGWLGDHLGRRDAEVVPGWISHRVRRQVQGHVLAGPGGQIGFALVPALAGLDAQPRDGRVADADVERALGMHVRLVGRCQAQAHAQVWVAGGQGDRDVGGRGGRQVQAGMRVQADAEGTEGERQWVLAAAVQVEPGLTPARTCVGEDRWFGPASGVLGRDKVEVVLPQNPAPGQAGVLDDAGIPGQRLATAVQDHARRDQAEVLVAEADGRDVLPDLPVAPGGGLPAAIEHEAALLVGGRRQVVGGQRQVVDGDPVKQADHGARAPVAEVNRTYLRWSRSLRAGAREQQRQERAEHRLRLTR